MRSTFSLVCAMIQALITQDIIAAVDVQGYPDTTLCLKLLITSTQTLNYGSYDTFLML